MSSPGTPDTFIRAARPEDAGLLLEMFRELAEFEHLEDQLLATEELILAALFGERPAAEALIAESEGEPAGYAVFFPTFSTFLAIQGIWLEDIYVRPAHRRAGVGGALLAAVAARLVERGGRRLEWSALDWNERALSFYAGIGAQRMDEWVTHRLIGEPLERLAARAGQVGGRL
jgi:GNAT superfamily N-acetyltransferase